MTAHPGTPHPLTVAAAVLLTMATLLAPAPALASRDETIAVLRQTSEQASAAGLRIAVASDGRVELHLGEEIGYRFASDEPGYLTAVHVNSHGITAVIFPNRLTRSVAIDAGGELSFPGASDGFTLEVEPPLGTEYVFAFRTEQAIEASLLGLDFGQEPFETFDVEQATAFARRLRERVGDAGGSYASAVLTMRVVGGEEIEYEVDQIVEYYSVLTRSLTRPKLDAHIHFSVDSDELDDAARKNLDQWGRALAHDQMLDLRFSVAGHTDATGSEDYNAELSRRRATSVRSYLIAAHGIDPERLELEALGETKPLEPNDSDWGRQMNRRVEFERR